MQPIIKVTDLTVRYEDRTVLDNINFSVAAGERFMILGRSGAGKTTLLTHMLGLGGTASGEILVDGDSIIHGDPLAKRKILRKIGVMYQSGALFGSMTLLENVSLPLEEFSGLPTDAIEAVAHNKLQMVGLGEFYNHLPSEISGGMQKRAAIARAMALDPKIIFMDEPSAGLDPTTSVRLDDLVLHLSETLGITFIVVSHELPSIYKVAERIIMLDDGKIVADGDPLTLRASCDNMAARKFFNREA
ncbi:MAG: ATP-binding cassette domain-containing protein [Gammaproteobacteria bacterium]|nr:ATP-binding cassette domain-containing protein [Gammaproteobacteria bacterium]